MPVSKLCRICLQEDKGRVGMQPLFDENNTRCAEIVQRIEECGGIVVSTKGNWNIFIFKTK